MRLELSGAQLVIVAAALRVYVEQQETLIRESSYSDIIGQRKRIAQSVLELLRGGGA